MPAWKRHWPGDAWRLRPPVIEALRSMLAADRMLTDRAARARQETAAALQRTARWPPHAGRLRRAGRGRLTARRPAGHRGPLAHGKVRSVGGRGRFRRKQHGRTRMQSIPWPAASVRRQSGAGLAAAGGLAGRGRLADLNRHAAALLALLGNLDEPPPPLDDAPQLAAHLQRLDQKLDLLLDLIGHWLQPRTGAAGPRSRRVWALRGVVWRAHAAAGPGRISLYLHAGTAKCAGIAGHAAAAGRRQRAGRVPRAGRGGHRRLWSATCFAVIGGRWRRRNARPERRRSSAARLPDS